MNYYDARELTKDGKPSGLFHYTRTNDGETVPVGYCADACPGHKTKEEAYAHYKKYLLERRTRFDVKLGTLTNCKVCDRLTEQGAQVGSVCTYPLCKKHLNLSALETLVVVGREASSC
jgi:hypothetical protein